MRICVFGSSSKQTSQCFVDCAFKLGELIASRSHVCVNGGGLNGCMGAVNKGARSKNGEIIGVIHEKWCVDGQEDNLISNMIVVGGDDLDERKMLLIENGDCIMALPGGVGTFDEIWDTVSCKAIGMKGMVYKPICLINTDGFYDGFAMQMERAHKEGLLYGPVDSFYFLASDIESAMDWCEEQCRVNKILQAVHQAGKVPAVNTRMTAKSQAKSHTAVEGTADDNISISALPSLIGSTVTPVTLKDDHTSGGHSSSSSGSSGSSSNSSKKWAVVGALAIGALAGFLGGIALSKGTIPRDFN